MAWTPNRSETCGEVSTLTLTSLTLPARSRASCSSAGLTMRQGPHQAQRSQDHDCRVHCWYPAHLVALHDVSARRQHHPAEAPAGVRAP